MYQTLRACFTTFPNTSKFDKNTPLHVVFLTLFSVFVMYQTRSFVFDTWHEHCCQQENHATKWCTLLLWNWKIGRRILRLQIAWQIRKLISRLQRCDLFSNYADATVWCWFAGFQNFPANQTTNNCLSKFQKHFLQLCDVWLPWQSHLQTQQYYHLAYVLPVYVNLLLCKEKINKILVNSAKLFI